MFELTRTVRFAINDRPREGAGGDAVRGPNGYAGVPSFAGLGRHYELDVVCAGPLSEVTGYLVNIKDVDAAVRAEAIPLIERTARGLEPGIPAEPAALLGRFLPGVNGRLGGVVRRVRWRLTPYHSIEMETRAASTVLIRQRFEFAASHRLHNPGLSAEENRRLYGKCNHPSGHGHNYVLEPCVESTLDPGGEPGMTLADLERIVTERVVDRFDHKHLNLDIPEFGPAGLNPSVENIARVSYELLAPAVATGGKGARLRSVTVWESEKTGATYPA